ncbi:hypothetical protein [Corynebacterium variabile]|uniref:hypothetical protein n=1 Tax=Corynebacterium variabile TaxID=1727 RepID=UPI003A923772
MITRQDVQLTLEALNPATSATEVDTLYTRIQDEKDQFRERAYMRMKTEHIEPHGTLPDWAKDVAIRDQAQMEAENTVRSLYLEPLTAQITEMEAELEMQEADLTEELAMQNPRAWADPDLRSELPEDRETFLDALEIWPEKDTGWQMIAGARLSQADYHDLPRPTGPGTLADQWAAEIQPVHEATEKDLARTRELMRQARERRLKNQ